LAEFLLALNFIQFTVQKKENDHVGSADQGRQRCFLPSRTGAETTGMLFEISEQFLRTNQIDLRRHKLPYETGSTATDQPTARLPGYYRRCRHQSAPQYIGTESTVARPPVVVVFGCTCDEIEIGNRITFH
jgi:hypothetical protein